MNYTELVSNGLADDISLSSSIVRKPRINIEFAADGARARKVVSRSNSRTTGKYPSWKVGRLMQYESLNERNAFQLLDACHEVKSFREQPCRIEYEMDGEKHIHFPDILVELEGRREFWEVKTQADAMQPEVARRTEFMESSLPLLGFGYRLVTAESLAAEPRLSNAKYFLKFGFKPISLEKREIVRRFFQGESEVKSEAFLRDSNKMALRDAVCRLILEGGLQFKFDHPLFPDSVIRINPKERMV